jgi:hypothetical protein
VEQLRLRGERAVAAEAVDRSVAPCRNEPRTRLGRYAVLRPALRGDRERLLSGILGQVEVAQKRDEARKDAAPLVTEDLLEQGYPSMIGRTSTAPPIRAAGIRAANAVAASRSPASSR